MINISPAAESDLAPIAVALSEFREHWRGFPGMPFACEFAGTLEDVTALDYLDYEGLGYPASDLKGAALVWGNVLAKQLGMVWCWNLEGDLLLHREEIDVRFTVWPYARVLEASERSYPHADNRYSWLLNRVIQDCLECGDSLSDDARAWCQQVLKHWEEMGVEWE